MNHSLINIVIYLEAFTDRQLVFETTAIGCYTNFASKLV